MIGTVVVTSRSFASGTLDLTTRLEEVGLEVVRCPADHEIESLRPYLAEAVAWIAGTGPVTARHVALAPHLQVLARYGVGTDAVDLSAAAAAGVLVTNTPGANSEAVAEHAIALLFATLRSIPAGDSRARTGDWTVTRGRQLGGSAVGVVGFGRIGRAVAARLLALGCTVLVHDPYIADETILEAGYRSAPLARIAMDCTVVSLHTPGETALIDAHWVADCSPGQVIVNTARAGAVDEDAVAAGLHAERLGGFAADTLSTESTPRHDSPLLDTTLADRVVVTPHLGAQTIEAVDSMGSIAVHDVLAVLTGREPTHPVAPPPNIPRSPGADR